MMKNMILLILIIPILVFAFSYKANYINGYLYLTFSDATSVVKVYIDNDEALMTSLDEVNFFVGKKSFNLKIEYKNEIYSKMIGEKPQCDLELVSRTATLLTYNLFFKQPFVIPPKITILVNNLQIIFTYKVINNKLLQLQFPISNNLQYFNLYVDGYRVKYGDVFTNSIALNDRELSVDLSTYTDFNGDVYWITLAARYVGYFSGKPVVKLKSNEKEIDISKYFINKFGYIFGTYKYKKGFLKDGEYTLTLKLGDFVKDYRVFVYRSLAFFPDIHKPISTEIYRIYTVKPGDTLYYIAVNNGTDVQSLVKINNFKNSDNIKAGERILIGKVRFAPSPDTIIISEADSRLYFFHNRKLIGSFFASPGVKGKTPLGKFQIIKKIKNPTLYWEGEVIPPLSPINGLGTRFLQLSDPQYGIHGTTKPWEIGRRVSHGCIRMMNCDVEKIFDLVQVGTNVYIVRKFSADSKLALSRIFSSYHIAKLK